MPTRRSALPILQSAEADLAKAKIELRKGPLLAEIDRLKNEAKLAMPRRT